MKAQIPPKCFRLNEMDREILRTWKIHLGFDAEIDVLRYALRKLGERGSKPISTDGADITYD